MGDFSDFVSEWLLIGFQFPVPVLLSIVGHDLGILSRPPRHTFVVKVDPVGSSCLFSVHLFLLSLYWGFILPMYRDFE